MRRQYNNSTEGIRRMRLDRKGFGKVFDGFFLCFSLFLMIYDFICGDILFYLQSFCTGYFGGSLLFADWRSENEL